MDAASRYFELNSALEVISQYELPDRRLSEVCGVGAEMPLGRIGCRQVGRIRVRWIEMNPVEGIEDIHVQLQTASLSKICDLLGDGEVFILI